ncbi:MAG: WXG100 family type VII secretion target [Eubacterium sp.]
MMDNSFEISVALQKLRDTEAKMQDVIISLNNIGQSISVITSKIDPFWEGETKDAYAEYLIEIINNVKKMESNITQRKVELNSALSAYETTEQKTQSSVEQLSTENIF